MINKKVILAYKVGFSDTEVGKKGGSHICRKKSKINCSDKMSLLKQPAW